MAMVYIRVHQMAWALLAKALGSLVEAAAVPTTEMVLQALMNGEKVSEQCACLVSLAHGYSLLELIL